MGKMWRCQQGLFVQGYVHSLVLENNVVGVACWTCHVVGVGCGFRNACLVQAVQKEKGGTVFLSRARFVLYFWCEL